MPPEPELGNSFGAMLIGTFIGIALYGAVVHQAYRYFRVYHDDQILIKALVLVVLALETFHIVACCHLSYHYLVANWGVPIHLINTTWSLNSLLACSGLIVFITQSFFARRVYILAPRFRILLGATFLLLVLELGFLTAASAETIIQGSFVGFKKLTWLVAAGCGIALVADGILTTLLVIILRKRRTGFERMDTVVHLLVLYTINTGMLTGIVDAMIFTFSILFTSNLIYAAFGIVCTKLYAISLLAALNERKSLTLRAMYNINEDWVDIPITPRPYGAPNMSRSSYTSTAFSAPLTQLTPRERRYRVSTRSLPAPKKPEPVQHALRRAYWDTGDIDVQAL
ncbi:uncharacterized protein BXZ73DRAFT_100955 [Epithele typhae]|uniref:uncharacterized protein n=1 Tax=Epithele typhae TaxID=378194 RepID=UPI0020079C9B|nr:uncharacterized protein BXZ73DRAFT_100955 [Epithele typhae]KAH9933570.1 hypothetical protein BXZ73DRAFT_100955 [Epithele typhae]